MVQSLPIDNGIIYFSGFGSNFNRSTILRMGLIVFFAKLVASTFHVWREELLFLTFLSVGIVTQDTFVKTTPRPKFVLTEIYEFCKLHKAKTHPFTLTPQKSRIYALNCSTILQWFQVDTKMDYPCVLTQQLYNGSTCIFVRVLTRPNLMWN